MWILSGVCEDQGPIQSKLDNIITQKILILKGYCLMTCFKGTHTVYFSSSFDTINPKPMIHRTDFHYIPTWVVHSSG